MHLHAVLALTCCVYKHMSHYRYHHLVGQLRKMSDTARESMAAVRDTVVKDAVSAVKAHLENRKNCVAAEADHQLAAEADHRLGAMYVTAPLRGCTQ
jgi:hypothetical protein